MPQKHWTEQTVICMKWGSLYSVDYVNRLYAMVRRNTTRPLRFICFTDDRDRIRREVEVHDMPPITLPDEMFRKPWRKVSLWQENLLDLAGDVLFLDIDLLVTGPIDDFFEYKPDKTFCVIHNWTTRHKSSAKYRGIGNTSCYRFRVGAHPYLYEMVQKDPIGYRKKYRNSQTFISNEISDIAYWPDEWCVSFKHSLLPSFPKRIFVQAKLPATTRIVAFTGKPDLHDVITGKWPERNPFKKIRKFFVKPEWVEELWHE